MRLVTVSKGQSGGGGGGGRERAWQDLGRVRQRLSYTTHQVEAISPGGPSGGGGGDALDHFVVSTHLLPRR